MSDLLTGMTVLTIPDPWQQPGVRTSQENKFEILAVQ